jgi:hypothetical protein
MMKRFGLTILGIWLVFGIIGAIVKSSAPDPNSLPGPHGYVWQHSLEEWAQFGHEANAQIVGPNGGSGGLPGPTGPSGPAGATGPAGPTGPAYKTGPTALTNSPVCAATSGTSPSNNVYLGTAAANLTPSLPSNCIGNDIIEYDVTQAAGAYSFTPSTSAAGGIVVGNTNGACPVFANLATGNEEHFQFIYNSVGAYWTELCPYTNPPQTGGPQYYADQCGNFGASYALPNNGSSDDAAPLRACMAQMPAGATMNLDGAKPYLFTTHSSTWTGDCAGYNGQSGEIAVCDHQTLNWHGATITSTETSVPPILMGSLQYNNPGASGGSPTFDAINDTAIGASSVTLQTAADAANYNPGDDIYIDCGSNSGNEDIFVGWNQVSDTHASTGVINLKYPMLKPYNHTATGCPASPSAARIYDWTTCGGGTCGANLGPLAHDVYLEGPGTLKIASGGVWSIVAQGLVNWGIDRINVDAHAGNPQFAFANNNHLGYITNSKIVSFGCSGDTLLNPGQFTSSFNVVDHDTATANGDPGVGCGSGTHEAVLGDSEGGESNKYTNDVVTVLSGLSSNVSGLGACGYFVGTWGDVIDKLDCTAPFPEPYGIIDAVPVGGTAGPTLTTPSQGPLKITNSHFENITGNSISFSIPYDTASGNLIECGNSGGCILVGNYPVVLTGNTINEYQCSTTTRAINVGNGANVITGNTLNDISGSCTTGILLGSSSSTAKLVISGNSIVGFGSPTNFSSSNFPAASVVGNPGVADYLPAPLAISSGGTGIGAGSRAYLTGGCANSISNSAASYCPINGNYNAEAATVQVEQLLPIGGTVHNLQCATPAVAGGTSIVMSIYDVTTSTSTALTCTETAAQSSCTDTTHSFSVVTGHYYTLQIQPSGTPTAQEVNCGVEVNS